MPQTLTEYIYQCLDSALDCGLTEFDFWSMTIGEIKRAIDSKIRREKRELQQQALLDYIQADLIGRSVGRFLVGDKVEYPTPEEAYTSLFEDKAKARKEEIENKRAELSVLRFKQFANFHNKKFKEVANVNE